MEFDPQLAYRRLMNLSVLSGALPGLKQILEAAQSKVLVIGAVVMDLYAAQNWLPEVKRKTGDLDLCVGLKVGFKAFKKMQKTLIASGYKTHRLKYRFFPDKVVAGELAYIDLLAFPEGKGVTEAQTRELMGVGKNFSFSGMEFAFRQSFQVWQKVHCPNPFGFMALKRAAYFDDPQNRRRDLADIIEFVSGFVEMGQHFEMAEMWKKLCHTSEAHLVKEMLEELAGQESPEWDIEDARQELLMRQFTSADLQGLVPRRIADFLQFL